MTALVFQLLKRLQKALDGLVAARAARAVPEWQMREVRAQISRLHNHASNKRARPLTSGHVGR